jgi:chitosanase
MLTETEKRTAQAIVNIFETGSARGEYGQVTLLAGDTGHLTYGRAQTTLASGNLYLLIKAYVATGDARFAGEMTPFLADLQNRDTALDHDNTFRRLLREAGEDPVMQIAQDKFFDRVYWEPTLKSAAYISVTQPLSLAVVYDSRIHGSWHALRDRTIAEHTSVAELGEEAWIAHYVEVRKHWLANHDNTLLHRTVYRMHAFERLIENGNWLLPLALEVRGVRLDEGVLFDEAPIRVSAEETFSRLLRLKDPNMRGDDVEELQRALAEENLLESADGVFGPMTDTAVRAFQQASGLVADGIVGDATRNGLGLA